MSFGKSEQAIELSRAVPSKATQSNGNGTTGAALVSAEILSRTALGHSKRKIARDLHIGRHRIDAILAQHQAAPLSTTRVARIIPVVHKNSVRAGFRVEVTLLLRNCCTDF